MLTCLAMSGVSTLFPVLLTPFFLGLFQKRQIKFDKKIVFVLAILLASISFIDVKNRIVYEYKCNIQKDYEIIVLDSNFTLSDLDNMYVDFSGEQDDSKFTKKLNDINIYSDTNKKTGAHPCGPRPAISTPVVIVIHSLLYGLCWLDTWRICPRAAIHTL